MYLEDIHEAEAGGRLLELAPVLGGGAAAEEVGHDVDDGAERPRDFDVERRHQEGALSNQFITSPFDRNGSLYRKRTHRDGDQQTPPVRPQQLEETGPVELGGGGSRRRRVVEEPRAAGRVAGRLTRHRPGQDAAGRGQAGGRQAQAQAQAAADRRRRRRRGRSAAAPAPAVAGVGFGRRQHLSGAAGSIEFRY